MSASTGGRRGHSHTTRTSRQHAFRRWERAALLRVAVTASSTLPPEFASAVVAADRARRTEALVAETGRGMRRVDAANDGVVAVFDDVATALAAARRLRRRAVAPGLRARYAISWGDVLFGPDGRPRGGETELLAGLTALEESDRARAEVGSRVPTRDVVLMAAGTAVALPRELREQVAPLGAFRVAGFGPSVEVWCETLDAFLGREPTNTEKMFGVSGADFDTLLDVVWTRRLENRLRVSSR